MPTEFDQAWYDEEYFFGTKGGKTYRTPNGKEHKWSYYSDKFEWTGCRPIVQAWKTIFQPRTMLDVGCGGGVFVAYARDFGVEAYGFDFSRFSIENHYSRCKPEWIWVGDARSLNDYRGKYDLVISLDLLEHIYLEDVDRVVENLFCSAEKYIFLQIAVCGAKDKPEKPYSLRRGEPVPIEFEGNAVAGHVNVQRREYWYEKFSQNDDWEIRYDLANWFKALVDKNVIRNWLENLILVVGRVE